MQDLRRRLRDVCVEYQANGPTAKLLYQKEQSKDAASRHLMTYASRRWNPLANPSSPISCPTSKSQRLKLANRQRCRTEVLSFDGNILRYVLIKFCGVNQDFQKLISTQLIVIISESFRFLN
uniref:Uncharacterized protein n=1 Tax=Solanum tuberosum TaxID=4113 RepID=M1BI75_SOLTU